MCLQIANAGRSSNEILAYFFSRFNKYLPQFILDNRKLELAESLQHDEDDDFDEDAYLQVQKERLAPRIFVWWIRFLTCEVNVKKQKESTNSRTATILRNFKSNIEKKSNDFLKKVVVKVLSGNQTLVDRALVDATSIYRYQKRQPIRTKSTSDSMDNSVSLFHSTSDGESLASKNISLCIGDQKSEFFQLGMGKKASAPFMGIAFQKTEDAKGVCKMLPRWHNDVFFVISLFDVIKPHLNTLETILIESKEMLIKALELPNNLPHFGSTAYPRDPTGFKNGNILMKSDPSFPLMDFFVSWNDTFLVGNFDEFSGSPHTEQPALSVKLGWLQLNLQELLDHLVRHIHKQYPDKETPIIKIFYFFKH